MDVDGDRRDLHHIRCHPHGEKYCAVVESTPHKGVVIIPSCLPWFQQPPYATDLQASEHVTNNGLRSPSDAGAVLSDFADASCPASFDPNNQLFGDVEPLLNGKVKQGRISVFLMIQFLFESFGI